MTDALLVAVDGGNSKTDAVLLRSDGTVLAAVRGPGSNPHVLGVEGAADVVGRLIETAWVESGVPDAGRPVLSMGAFFMAGADQPDEERDLHAAIARRGWADRVLVANDTLALLWAGSSAGWGVAVVVGAGINCVGLSDTGVTARFAALGLTTGDWGGGSDIGMAALGAGVRAEDGRGPLTTLTAAVAGHFGTPTALEVGLAMYAGRIDSRRLVELPRLVFAAAAAGDEAAGAIVDRQADEVALFAVAALRRIGHTHDAVEVVLGGAVMTAAPARLLDRVRARVAAVAPRAQVVLCVSRPLVGAAVAALTVLGAGDAARVRLREELTEERITAVPGPGEGRPR